MNKAQIVALVLGIALLYFVYLETGPATVIAFVITGAALELYG